MYKSNNVQYLYLLTLHHNISCYYVIKSNTRRHSMQIKLYGYIWGMLGHYMRLACIEIASFEHIHFEENQTTQPISYSLHIATHEDIPCKTNIMLFMCKYRMISKEACWVQEMHHRWVSENLSPMINIYTFEGNSIL